MTTTNRRRIVRALEVTIGSGRPFSSFGPGHETYPATSFRLIGVSLPAEVVARRITDRYAAQIDSGFVDEVRGLSANPSGMSRTASQALGYKELAAHLRGECTLDEAIEIAERRTRQFARRQRAWFRRDPRIEWLDVQCDPGEALPSLEQIVSRPAP
jgi:tRNA dimethylallyltransferase